MGNASAVSKGWRHWKRRRGIGRIVSSGSLDSETEEHLRTNGRFIYQHYV